MPAEYPRQLLSIRHYEADYEDHLYQYEGRLKGPYYLLCQPDVQELTLLRHTGRKYVSVKPNAAERYVIPELELEVALLDGWLRYWFRGELLPLPADLLRKVDEFRQLWQEEKLRADGEKRRADDAEKRAHVFEQELARLRALLGQKP